MSKIRPCWDSEIYGIPCLESESQYGFRKSINDLRPSSCTWVDKEDFEKLYFIIKFQKEYSKQFKESEDK